MNIFSTAYSCDSILLTAVRIHFPPIDSNFESNLEKLLEEKKDLFTTIDVLIDVDILLEKYDRIFRKTFAEKFFVKLVHDYHHRTLIHNDAILLAFWYGQVLVSNDISNIKLRIHGIWGTLKKVLGGDYFIRKIENKLGLDYSKNSGMGA